MTVRLGRALRLAGAALVLAAAGCDTRVVELVRTPDAGGPAPVCSEFVRDDRALCRICFGDTGAITSLVCAASPDAASVPPVPAGTCLVTVVGSDRCALCADPMSGQSRMTCLECALPVTSSAGGQCRVCAWSDDPSLRCLQCFDAGGVASDDGCDRVRRETFVYPPPQNTGSGP